MTVQSFWLLLAALVLAAVTVNWRRVLAPTRKGKTMTFKIELGSTVVDKITGYKGTVIGRTEWLYGCRRYTIQAKELKDGKPVESWAADEDALDIAEQAAPHVMKETGGTAPEPARRADAARR